MVTESSKLDHLRGGSMIRQWCVHAESWRSGGRKAILVGIQIEGLRWGQGAEPRVLARELTWRRSRRRRGRSRRRRRKRGERKGHGDSRCGYGSFNGGRCPVKGHFVNSTGPVGGVGGNCPCRRDRPSPASVFIYFFKLLSMARK